MADTDDVILDAGQPGSRITVTLGELTSPRMAHLPGHRWRHAEIRVDATPFAGTIQTTFTERDITDYQREAQPSAAGASQARFGGDRAPLITLERHGENLEVSVTPSGDDPWPRLCFLIFRA